MKNNCSEEENRKKEHFEENLNNFRKNQLFIKEFVRWDFIFYLF